MISGARKGAFSGLRKLVAAAMAQELKAFVVPGPELARAHGLDLAKAGLPLAVTPRHAGVLLIISNLPEGLRDAASVAYAQMPRPRAILALGAGNLAPLPVADVSADLTQEGLLSGLAQLRRAIAAGAFGNDVTDFEAPALEIRVEYTCPMHPEVVSDKPGNCPKCGMVLMPRETDASGGHAGHTPNESEATMSQHNTPEHSKHASAEAAQYTCPMHPEVVSAEPGSCPKCGMFLMPVEGKDADDKHSGHGEHSQHASAEATQYTCPMHPEVVSAEPGSCPKCGMFLVPVDDKDADDKHSGHGNHASAETDDGIEAHFMSMVGITKDLPRSSDGLQMDWLEVPYGPFFPGLPGGLGLQLTLDGDTVSGTGIRNLVGFAAPLVSTPVAAEDFIAQMMKTMPHAPVSYGLLAVCAIENAAGTKAREDTARGRAAALERERIASHLSWLSDFGAQTGFRWLATSAAALQLKVQGADTGQIAALTPAITALLGRLRRAPLMRMRLKGIARLDDSVDAAGPLARAIGLNEDVRSDDQTFSALGFSPALRTGGDALARLQLRCDEIDQSLKLIAAAGIITAPVAEDIGKAKGEGAAALETPRGAAHLRLVLKKGKVISAELDTPSTRHVALIEDMTAQQELGDALVAINSLDLSPWEIGMESRA